MQTSKLRHLLDLISMAEMSEQYRVGEQWAVDAVIRLRLEITHEREQEAGYAALRRSATP